MDDFIFNTPHDFKYLNFNRSPVRTVEEWKCGCMRSVNTLDNAVQWKCGCGASWSTREVRDRDEEHIAAIEKLKAENERMAATIKRLEAAARPEPTHHEILGVTPTATKAEIKNAYRRAALFWHPDKNKSPNAAATFKLVVKAYEALG